MDSWSPRWDLILKLFWHIGYFSVPFWVNLKLDIMCFNKSLTLNQGNRFMGSLVSKVYCEKDLTNLVLLFSYFLTFLHLWGDITTLSGCWLVCDPYLKKQIRTMHMHEILLVIRKASSVPLILITPRKNLCQEWISAVVENYTMAVAQSLPSRGWLSVGVNLCHVTNFFPVNVIDWGFEKKELEALSTQMLNEFKIKMPVSGISSWLTLPYCTYVRDTLIKIMWGNGLCCLHGIENCDLSCRKKVGQLHDKVKHQTSPLRAFIKSCYCCHVVSGGIESHSSNQSHYCRWLCEGVVGIVLKPFNILYVMVLTSDFYFIL